MIVKWCTLLFKVLREAVILLLIFLGVPVIREEENEDGTD